MKKITLIIISYFLILSQFFGQSLSDSLVAHYFLDGNGDDAIGNNHGTVMGAIAVDDRNGTIDGAYQFDGIDDWIDIGNTPDLEITGDITVSSWVKTPSSWPTTYHDTHIYARYTYSLTTPTGVALYLDNPHLSNRSFSFILRAGGNSWGNDYAVSLTTLQLDTWYFVVGVREGNSMEIYVNGLLENTDLGSNDPINYGANPVATIGEKNASASGWYDGVIDDVRIYKRGLSASEILDLFTLTVSVETNNSSELQFSIYPNPTSDYLMVNVRGNSKIKELRVTNLNGQIIKENSIENNIIQLDVNDLKSGIYFIQLFGKDGLVSTSKFFKI
tara:strand:- start:2713 stop:3705 length:993 start_codon:yes stop_codon:yes gene_type:complete